MIGRLLFLADFNNLILESDPETSVENLQKISLFALLCLINLSKNSPYAQAIGNSLEIVEILIKLLKNGVYEPKNTVLTLLAVFIDSKHAEN